MTGIMNSGTLEGIAGPLGRSLLLVALLWGPAASKAQADQDSIPFSEADLFFELNDTDGDLGIHANIDGEPWKQLQIESPDERQLLDIRVRSKLRKHGLTQLSFESAEPTFDELEPETFFARFPEGTYEIEGTTLEGDELESPAELTHLLPGPPDGILVSGTAIDPDEVDCDEEPLPLVAEPVVIDWEPVTESHPELGRTGEPVETVQYQLVLERDDLVYSVELPPDVTELEVPLSFTALGEDFKFEILVKEASGNQTAVESCFELE